VISQVHSSLKTHIHRKTLYWADLSEKILPEETHIDLSSNSSQIDASEKTRIDFLEKTQIDSLEKTRIDSLEKIEIDSLEKMPIDFSDIDH
jgi:hypothetical protein